MPYWWQCWHECFRQGIYSNEQAGRYTPLGQFQCSEDKELATQDLDTPEADQCETFGFAQELARDRLL